MIAILMLFLFACNSSKNAFKNNYEQKIKLATDSGVIVLKLYNQTPLHRNNFIKLVKQHYFDSLMFHRVIKNFMIQGGDPDSKRAKPGVKLGEGGPKYTIPAEFDSTIFHKKGVIAAARESDEVNPKRESSASQFYIVQGKVFTDKDLDAAEIKRNIVIPEYRRKIYRTIGGTPHLDMKYTVFGEVISGLDVVDKIAAAKTDSNNRPDHDIRMKIRLIKKGRG
ncbi:MAG: peptidylprolyl isomerase [Ginsengibacter sp.]